MRKSCPMSESPAKSIAPGKGAPKKRMKRARGCASRGRGRKEARKGVGRGQRRRERRARADLGEDASARPHVDGRRVGGAAEQDLGRAVRLRDHGGRARARHLRRPRGGARGAEGGGGTRAQRAQVPGGGMWTRCSEIARRSRARWRHLRGAVDGLIARGHRRAQPAHRVEVRQLHVPLDRRRRPPAHHRRRCLTHALRPPAVARGGRDGGGGSGGGSGER